MRNIILVLSIILICGYELYSQCENENIVGIYLISEQVNQCELIKIGVDISEDMVGQTQRGNFEITHKEDVTIIEICYFRDDEPQFAMPSIYNDEVEMSFEESGQRKLEFRIKNSLTINEKNCEVCSDYYIDTLSIDVLPSNEYVFSPNPTKDFLKAEATLDREFSDKLLNLYSINGQFIQTFEVDSNNNLIDLRKFPAGVYILEDNHNNCDRKIEKIVKVE